MEEEKKDKEEKKGIEEDEELDETELVDESELLAEETQVLEAEKREKITSIALVKKAYLLAIDGPFLGRKFTVRFDTTKIGRSADYNHIVLPDDRKTSKRHATIIVRGGKYIISDKRSKNRTYVNRKKLKEIEEFTLSFGDEIEIGASIFRFAEEGKEDFSPPRRAGSFWLRHKFNLIKAASFIILIIFGYLSYDAYTNIYRITKIPDPLQLKDLGKNKIELSISPEDFANYHSTIAILKIPHQNSNDVLFCNDAKVVEMLSGSNLKTIRTITDEPFDKTSGVTLVDFDRNGVKDIAVVSQNSKVEIFDCTQGSTIHKTGFLGGMLLTPTFGDIDGNLSPDLVIATKEGKIYFGTAQEETMPYYTTYDTLVSPPIIADIDADGISEVIEVSRDGIIYIMDGKTQQPKEREINLKEKIKLFTQVTPPFVQVLASPAAGEINGREGKDIVIACRHGDIVAIDGRDKEIFWHRNLFSDSEPPLPRFPQPLKYASPVLADFNSDGILDVLVFALNGYIVALRGTDGKILWKKDLGELAIGTPALADINKDGVADVIFGTDSSGIFGVLNGKNGEPIFQYSIGEPITSSPVVGDINGNGYLDITLLTNNGNLISRETNTLVKKNEIIWGMENFNAERTGAFPISNINLKPYYLKFYLTGFFIILIAIEYILIGARKRRRTKFILGLR